MLIFGASVGPHILGADHAPLADRPDFVLAVHACDPVGGDARQRRGPPVCEVDQQRRRHRHCAAFS